MVNGMETGDKALDERLRESASIAPPETSDADWASVADQLRAEQGMLARLRAMPTRGRIGVLVALIVLVSVGVGLGTPRADLSVFPVDRLLIGLGLLVVGVLAGLVVAFRPVHRPFRPDRATIAVAVAVVIPMVLAVLPPAHEAHPASLEGIGDDLVKRAVACFLFGTACAVPVVLAGWVFVRRGLVHGWLAASVLVAAAAVGNVALMLHCPLTAVIHRAAGHASIALSFAVLGVAALAALRRK